MNQLNTTLVCLVLGCGVLVASTRAQASAPADVAGHVTTYGGSDNEYPRFDRDCGNDALVLENLLSCVFGATVRKTQSKSPIKTEAHYIVVEAEGLNVRDWQVSRSVPPSRLDYASGRAVIESNTKGAVASKSLVIAQSGMYRLWIRS